MLLAEVNAAIDDLPAHAQTTRPRLRRFQPLSARDAGDRQQRRIVERLAMQQHDLMSTAAQLANHRVVRAEHARTLANDQNFHQIVRYLDPDARRPASSVASIMLVGSATPLPAMSNAVP